MANEASNDAVRSDPAVVLAAVDVEFRRNRRKLLSGIDLTLPGGVLTVVAGPNGAGKSTLLRLFAGEWRPSRGQILWQDRSVLSVTVEERARRRAFLAQEIQVAFSFQVHEIVAMGREPHRGLVSKAENETIVENAMREMDLLSLKNRDYGTLSGGEKQRVHLSRVLAQIWPWSGGSFQESVLLFLDEPMNGLDPFHQRHLYHLLRRLAQAGVAVIVALHDLSLAARLAERWILLREGTLVAEGTSGEVLKASVLGEVFRIPMEVGVDSGMGYRVDPVWD